ncbi:metallophosphoesterase [Marinifilum fragile]|uniref:metallophosphoesterase n=1 Tax=Marinifilum fragile TaxID=570161 RepID=UPI002AA6C493|nr:metallophosphoesterase [Marinifilum fragile]
MNNIIIHISDLHITDKSERYEEKNKYTYLVNDEEVCYSFFDSLINSIKKYNCKERYLIITGDITNIAEKVEFEQALISIKQLIEGLKIKKQNILLIPGDHEVHRRSILNALDLPENDGKQGFSLNEVKYKNFQTLYKDIKGVDFDYERIIFDSIQVGKLLILGVNSNDKVGQKGANGFIQLQKFDKEIQLIIDKHPDKEVLLAFHHNISGTYEDKRTGQWDKNNRKDLFPYLLKHNVKCVFHGNEHTPKSELDSSGIYLSDSGALAGIDPPGSYKIYEVELENDSIILRNKIFQLRKINGIPESNFGDWITILPKEISVELDYFEIYKARTNTAEETIDLPLSIDGDTEVIEEIKNESNPVFYAKESIQNKLYDIIRDKKLYYSGHFHWSESSRSHNWIDIAKLLECKDDLYFAKSVIVDVIETFSLNKDCDLIIGLGAEGNILATKASIKFPIPYTSLPYSYRYGESHTYETKLNFNNDKGDFKTVIIITDVVNDGKTIRRLIADNEKDFFQKVDKVIVISLFYTGHENINIDILNHKKLPETHDRKNDFKVDIIEFYAVKSLRVEKCPYGSNYKEECFIYKDDLSCVNLFYDEGV